MYHLTHPTSENFLTLAGVAFALLVLSVLVEKFMAEGGAKTFVKLVLWPVVIYCAILTVAAPVEPVAKVQAQVLTVAVEGSESPLVMAKLKAAGEVFFLEIPSGMPLGKSITVYQKREPRISAMQFAKGRVASDWASICGHIERIDISKAVKAIPL